MDFGLVFPYFILKISFGAVYSEETLAVNQEIFLRLVHVLKMEVKRESSLILPTEPSSYIVDSYT